MIINDFEDKLLMVMNAVKRHNIILWNTEFPTLHGW